MPTKMRACYVVSFLLLFTLCLALPPVPAFAQPVAETVLSLAGSEGTEEGPKSFASSSNFQGPRVTFLIEDGVFQARGIAEDKKSAGMLCFVRPSSGKSMRVCYFSVWEKTGEWTASLDLNLLADGDYYVATYFCEPGDDRYWSSLYNGARLRVKQGDGYFVPSAAFAQNSRMQERNAVAPKKPSETGARAADDKITQKALELTEDLKSDYEKALVISEYLAGYLFYDWNAYYEKRYPNVSPLYVYQVRRTICQGFVNVALQMFQAADLPARMVEGICIWPMSGDLWSETDLSVSNHSWNEVYVDGRWLTVDITWMCQNQYQNGQYLRRPMDHLYFDIDLETFSYDHLILSYGGVQ